MELYLACKPITVQALLPFYTRTRQLFRITLSFIKHGTYTHSARRNKHQRGNAAVRRKENDASLWPTCNNASGPQVYITAFFFFSNLHECFTLGVTGEKRRRRKNTQPFVFFGFAPKCDFIMLFVKRHNTFSLSSFSPWIRYNAYDTCSQYVCVPDPCLPVLRHSSKTEQYHPLSTSKVESGRVLCEFAHIFKLH